MQGYTRQLNKQEVIGEQVRLPSDHVPTLPLLSTTHSHKHNISLNIHTVACSIKGYYRFTWPFVLAVDRDQPSMCYSKEVLSSTQHIRQWSL